jgi:hypothetical protein
LLWVQLKLFREFNTDPTGIEKLHDLLAIFHLRARGVSQRKACTAVFDPQNV